MGRSATAAGRSAPRPPPPRNPPPHTVKRAPPPAPVQSRSGGSMLGSTIAEGMAFGTGNAVAQRAVDAVMGPRTIQHETAVASIPNIYMGGSHDASCGVQSKAFMDCLNSSPNDISKCQFYMDIYAV